MRSKSLIIPFLLACCISIGACTDPPNRTGSTGTGARTPTPTPVDAGVSSQAVCYEGSARITFSPASRRQKILGAKTLTIDKQGLRSIDTAKPEQAISLTVEGAPSGDSWTAWVLHEASKTHQDFVLDKERPTPSLSEVDQFLDDMTRVDTYVGYIGTEEIAVPFVITCDKGEHRGSINTWSIPTMGVLACSRSANKELTRLARRYC